ncbi:hypothetical protein Acsp02_04490 [Actinoplanes sp. NBRC 103695]|nr:hypothetical protein Acsp02_04490 [Actinoplanes sp. NBRC 103695]
MDRAQLTPEVRAAFRTNLFERVLGECLEDDVRADLAASTLPHEFVRERCRKDLIDNAHVALDPIDVALLRLAVARAGRVGTGRLVYFWTLTRGWRLVVTAIAMALWTGAFALSSAGAYGHGSARPILLWVVVALIVVVLLAVWRQRVDGKDVRLYLVQVAALAAFPWILIVSALRISLGTQRESAAYPAFVVAAMLLIVAVSTWATLSAHLRGEPCCGTTVKNLPLQLVTTAAVLIGIAGPVIGLVVIINLDDSPLRFDIGLPDPLLAVAALTLHIFDAVIAVPGRRRIRVSTAEEQYRRSRSAALAQLRESVVVPYVRQMISDNQPSFETTLAVTRPGGLSQSFDPLYEIPTSATRRLRALINGMPGGSVGVAGPRGVGKSTVLGSLCEHGRPEPGLRLLVSAPVEYSPREFLLHLYARVCREALTWRADGGEPPDPIDSVLSARSNRVNYAISGVVGAGALLIFTTTAFGHALNNSQILAVVLATAAVALAAQTWSRRPTRKRGLAAGSLSLEAAARDRLNEIEYQQSISGEWSGTIKVPAGLESTLKRASGFVRQPKNLPEIVDSLRQFLRMIAAEQNPEATTRLIIGIDELDKIESEERAQQFLNDIKSIFGVPGWHFLVSVSEDAMASFERRGLPFRDAFDSAFDEIVSIDYLSFQECSDLLSRRTTEIPVPFKGLSFCLSGGLPRDLIRAARQMITQPDGGSRRRDLSSVARRLVTRDLAGKANAVTSAVRKIDAEPITSSLIIWCGHATFHVTTPDAMADAVREVAQLDLNAESAFADEAGRAALCRLAREIVSYTYYCQTLVEFFTGHSTDARWQQAVAKGRRGFDELARTRRTLALNPLVGWHLINRFRTEWQMATIEVPPNLAGGSPAGAEPRSGSAHAAPIRAA